MTAQVKPGSCPVVLDDDGDILVVGVGRIFNKKYYDLAATEATLVAADLQSLATVLRDPNRYQANVPCNVMVVAGQGDLDWYFDPQMVWLEVNETTVVSVFEVTVPARRRLKDAEYARLLDPPLATVGCRLDRLEFQFWDGTDETDVDIIDWSDAQASAEAMTEGRFLRVRIAGDTVADLLAGGHLARALLLALTDGALHATSAAHLIRAGHVQSIIGLPESEWLEVKSEGYQLASPKERGERLSLELARDVARFANGDTDAVLLVGYKTGTTAAGEEVVTALTPVKVMDANVERHQKVIDARVYPTVEGLRVDCVPVGEGRAVLLIEIPRQPDALKPFLVHGAIVDGRSDGSFISIVARRGSHSVATTPSQLHAYLVAARALLLNEGRNSHSPGAVGADVPDENSSK